MPSLEFHVISCTQKPMLAPERLSKNIWFHLLHVPKIGWLRSGYQGCIRAIRRKLRDIGPDIVHGQGTERECALGAVFSGFPNVITLHGIMTRVARAMNTHPGSYYWWAAVLERLALPRTLGVLCNSVYTETVVRPVARKTWHVPNAVRREFLERPIPQKAMGEKPIILNVGVISPYKRQLEVLGILERVHASGCAFELDFIGDAEPGNAYVSSFQRQLDRSRDFALRHEPKSLVDLMAMFDRASALIHLPSEEAFGLVVAEALARNLKVFCARTGGLIDIATGSEGAELYPLNDSNALVRGITDWMQKGAALPATANATIRGRYHPDVVAKKHLEVYHEALA